MKVVFILLSFLLLKSSFAQDSFINCFQVTYQHMERDSVAFNHKEWKNCVKGKHIPEFEAISTLGKRIKSKDLKGKVVIINFWFIDCHPCIAELPALNRLVKEYEGKDVVFLAPTWETKDRLKSAFFQKYKFDFMIISDAKKIIDLFGGVGFPVTYIVDKNGILKEVTVGGPIDEKSETQAYLNAKPIIDELLKAE